ELAMPSGANDAQRDDRLKRFLREARAAGSLQHPNIMTVFEVGEDSGRHYIAMEYLDGHTLRNEIDTKGFIPVEDAIQLSKDVLSGLDY
ncbi:protein kinase domain-containing protein, partial [Vibrio parahaemolyticus]